MGISARASKFGFITIMPNGTMNEKKHVCVFVCVFVFE
jgi:hypothetical protein